MSNEFTRALAISLANVTHDLDCKQRDVAHQMGLPGSYLSAIKRGDKAVTPSFVDKWCDWLSDNGFAGSIENRIEWHRLGAMSRGWQLSPTVTNGE